MRLLTSYQAFSTVRATPARLLAAPASLSRTGARTRKSALSCSTTSRLSNKRGMDGTALIWDIRGADLVYRLLDRAA